MNSTQDEKIQTEIYSILKFVGFIHTQNLSDLTCMNQKYQELLDSISVRRSEDVEMVECND